MIQTFLELINVNKDPIISELEIEGENVQKMCPTINCELEFVNSSFIPLRSNNMTIAHTIGFNLKYNSTTDANIDSIEKEHIEKFSECMNSCLIYDTMENEG